MNSYTNTIKRFTIVPEYFQSSSEYGQRSTPFWQNMQLQNEFPNSCFARILDWERGVTLNHGNRRWATAWTQMKPECN